MLLLALLQFGTGFKYQILRYRFGWQASRNLRQQGCRQCAATCAYFKHGSLNSVGDDLGKLNSQRLTKQGTEFGRGNKIPRLAKFLGTRHVITKTGSIQRQLHESGEIQWAVGVDTPIDLIHQPPCMGKRQRVRCRQALSPAITAIGRF